MKRTSTPLLWALALTLFAGCSAPPPDTGSVQLIASMPQALSSADVTRVKVTVSASEISPLIVELSKSNGTWGGLISSIPAGSGRAFLAQAFDSTGTLRYQGQTSGVTLAANQTTAVALTLQELSPPPPYSNEAPVIDSLVASSTSVQTGSSLSLTATVHDPNPGDSLTLAWTAATGTFSNSSATSTSWTAPAAPGPQTLTFTVTDSQGAAVSVSLTVNVVVGDSVSNAALDISFNLWPTVSRISSSLNRLGVGQSTAVSAQASDADGDSLSYAWTASCPGTWTNAASSSASFVPSSIPAGACNNCRLTATVQDGRGGQTTGVLDLCIAAPSTGRFPPSFTNAYQSATSATPGQAVAFEVTALDPQSSAMTFAWTVNAGRLSTAQNTASTSRVVWTAPTCTLAGVTPTLTLTATNAYGRSATRTFTLSGLSTCVLGSWTATGSMAAARNAHTAVKLLTDKVLVMGGGGLSGDLASAELYNPTTGTWSSAGSMAAARTYFTATLLPSGKVLVAGGYRSTGAYLASAELYNPATNSWSSAGTMASMRASHTATLLPNGKVLIAGGGLYPDSLASAELYDPATNSWSQAAPLILARADATATLLPNGKVLVAGGAHGPFAQPSAELYDPATNSWSLAGSMTSPRFYHTATLLNSGKVLVTGAYGQPGIPELYDPATNSWSLAGSMQLVRFQHTATLLPSGKVLIAGGYNGAAHAEAELYDPATNSWAPAAPMTSEHVVHTATLLPNGKVLIAGGYSYDVIRVAELYTP